MSEFDERKTFKKRVITASITAKQRVEFDLIKRALGITSDGALIKKALADLSAATPLGTAPLTPEFVFPVQEPDPENYR